MHFTSSLYSIHIFYVVNPVCLDLDDHLLCEQNIAFFCMQSYEPYTYLYLSRWLASIYLAWELIVVSRVSGVRATATPGIRTIRVVYAYNYEIALPLHAHLSDLATFCTTYWPNKGRALLDLVVLTFFRLP